MITAITYLTLFLLYIAASAGFVWLALNRPMYLFWLTAALLAGAAFSEPAFAGYLWES